MSSPSRHGIAWGFLSCSFLGCAALFLSQDPNVAFGTATGLSGLWAALIALASWQPPTGGGE